MKKGRVFWGILFILAAVYVVISQFGIFPDVGIVCIALTILFAWLCVEGLRSLNFYEMLLPLAGIYWLYQDRLHESLLSFLWISPWAVFGAALLVSIGLSLLFDGNKRRHVMQGVYAGSAGGSADGQQCTGEQIRLENNFGTVIRYVTSDNLKNATLENNFGTLTVYFDNAIVQSGSAFVNIENSFGAVNLYIPKEWKTRCSLAHSFGAVNERGLSLGTSLTEFYLNGDTSFGTVNIYYI